MRSSSFVKREKNKAAATKCRNNKKQQLEKLKREVARWKGKCKTLTSKGQFHDFEKELEEMKLQWGTSTSEEQTSSNETPEATAIESGSKYRNRYEPKTKMNEVEKAEWRVEQRKQRNRETAKRSYINKQKRRIELEMESKFWEGKYNGLTSKTTNDNSTSISTSNGLFSSDSMESMLNEWFGSQGQLFSTSSFYSIENQQECDRIGKNESSASTSMSSRFFSCNSMDLSMLNELFESQRQLFPKSISHLFNNEQGCDRGGMNGKIRTMIQPDIQISLDDRPDDKCDKDFDERFVNLRRAAFHNFVHQSGNNNLVQHEV